MTVQCADCGKFISYDDMVTGEALFSFEPLSDLGPERCEWTCRRCVLPPRCDSDRHPNGPRPLAGSGSEATRARAEGIAQPDTGAA